MSFDSCFPMNLFKTFISLPLVILFSTAFAWPASARQQKLLSVADCHGSYALYPVPKARAVAPDSLTPLMINHVGRHGARYQTSANRCVALIRALNKADSIGTITPLGIRLRKLVKYVVAESTGKWGELDSIGMLEQRGIAQRMYNSFRPLFDYGSVCAISSYVPRCVMSMYTFCHELSLLDSRVTISTLEGHITSPLLRPFSTDSSYILYRDNAPYSETLSKFKLRNVPVAPVERILGKTYPISEDKAKDFAIVEYRFLISLLPTGINVNLLDFISLDELNSIWSFCNLEQYFERTGNEFSEIPENIAYRLVQSFLWSAQSVINGSSNEFVQLRFGHAETLMPFLSLLRVPGCYFMTTHPDEAASHWQNFRVVPMASNFQMILFKSRTGRIYARFDLNEVPLRLIDDYPSLYVPWDLVRKYLSQCIAGATVIPQKAPVLSHV